jgi:NAD(P)H-flavin reductase
MADQKDFQKAFPNLKPSDIAKKLKPGQSIVVQVKDGGVSKLWRFAPAPAGPGIDLPKFPKGTLAVANSGDFTILIVDTEELEAALGGEPLTDYAPDFSQKDQIWTCGAPTHLR